jgi:hypothetical protein
MTDDLDTGSRNGPGQHSRRVLLGAAATLGLLAPAAPAALAATIGRQSAELRAGRQTTEDAAAPGAGAGAGPLWGTSPSGEGAGVRGNGRVGIAGEGTHAGVTGDGFVGVRGTTSLLEDDERGVGVWAEAVAPGSTALHAEGPSQFNGLTTFARSGVVKVPAGSANVTVQGVELTEASAILATLQHRAGGVHLHAVETDPAAQAFTIYLTAAPPRELPVAWFALG